MSIRDDIVSQYGAKTLRKSAMNIRGGAGVFERVLKGKGIKVALEIGTYKGCATAEIAQHVERVITIDLDHGKLELNGEVWNRYAFWDSLGVHNVELHLVKDDAEKKSLLDSIDFDFAFIDGDHGEGVKLDYDLTKRCGRVLFHDYDSRGPGKDTVFDFVNTLPKHQVQVLDIFALWTR